MIILSNKDYKKLTQEEQNQYLLTWLQEQLDLSIRKTQSSDNYKLPAWPYLQAEQLGTQKILTKFINLIT